MAALVDTIPGVSWLRRLKIAWDLHVPRRSAPVLTERRWVREILTQESAVVERVTGRPVEALAIRRLLLTETGVVVAIVGPDDRSGKPLVVKVEAVPLAAESLTRNREIVQHLRAHPALGAIRDALPEPLAQGVWAGRSYVLESALSGMPGRRFLAHARSLAWLQQRAVERISVLAEATLARRTIDTAELARLAGGALDRLEGPGPLDADDVWARLRLAEIRGLLERELVGRTLPLTWVHGDYWPGNVLVSWRTGTISGIVDWDRATADELPVHDLFHLLTYPSAMLRHYRHAEVIVEKLIAGDLDPVERRLTEAVTERLGLPADAGFRRAAALVYWLRVMDTNFARFPHRRTDQRWLERNFWPVLLSLGFIGRQT